MSWIVFGSAVCPKRTTLGSPLHGCKGGGVDQGWLTDLRRAAKVRVPPQLLFRGAQQRRQSREALGDVTGRSGMREPHGSHARATQGRDTGATQDQCKSHTRAMWEPFGRLVGTAGAAHQPQGSDAGAMREPRAWEPRGSHGEPRRATLHPLRDRPCKGRPEIVQGSLWDRRGRFWFT